jgi:2-phospho-L-lactate/phosphoenolpyruvate guanylyltransferase
MSLWAIVPVKPLKRGKSRLASVLSDDERTVLNQSLLVNTISTLGKVKSVDKILVVSRDPHALAIAREYNARTVLEDGSPELNTALRRAVMVARAYQANEILVLPADLPLIKSADVERFLMHSGNPPELIIAPDRRHDGTNALFLSPAGLIDFSYGEGSFNIHLELAKKANARIEVVEDEVFGLDLDLPEDLELLRSIEGKTEPEIIKLMEEE